MDLLVTYDISTPDPEGHRRLLKVAKICESFGVRVQYSVFECRLSAARLQKLKQQLGDVIDPDVDSVRVYHFVGSLADSVERIGRNSVWDASGPWIV